jgi:D-xylose transport system substrate-binding protein
VRQVTTSAAVLGVLSALLLGGCDSGPTPPGPTAGPVPGGAACTSTGAVSSPSTTFVATPRPSATQDATRAPREGPARTVGVILPEPGPGAAPVGRESALLVGSLTRAGLTPLVRSPHDDGVGYGATTRGLVRDGIRVLVLVAPDPAAGARAEEVADLAGVEVVEYGGMVVGGSAPYAVSPDYRQIGRLQAQTLVACLRSRGVVHPRLILVNGGTDVDQNAVLLAMGAHQVLDPLATTGAVDLQVETSVPAWQAGRAAARFDEALDASGDRVDGVLVAGDALAEGVLEVLHQRGLDGTLVVGQGASARGLQDVAAGRLSATVRPDLEQVAEAAALLVGDIVAGRERALAALPLAPFADPAAPARTLTVLWVPGQVVTRDTVGDVTPAGVRASAGSRAPHPSS